MVSNLKRWYSLEIYDTEDKRRIARFQLNLILLHWIISGTLFAMNRILWFDRTLEWVTVFGAGAQIVSMWLLLRGRLVTSGWVSLVIYIGITTALATEGGGIHDVSIVLYPIIILLAGVVGQRRGLYIATGLSILSFIWLVVGEDLGVIARDYNFTAFWWDAVFVSLLLLVATYTVNTLVSDTSYGLLQSWQELVERKRLEEDLRDALQREHFLADIIRDTSIMVGVINLEGSVKLINKAVVHQTGYSEEELLELNWITDLTPEEWWGNENEKLKQLSHTRTSVRYEKEIIRKDGSRFPVELIVHPHLNAEGNIDAFLSFATDITDRKRIEDTLRLSEERYRLLADASPQAIVVSDLETGRVVYANQLTSMLFGIPLEELLGSNANDRYLNPQDREMVLNQIHEQHSVIGFELPLKKGDDSPFWASLTANLSVFENRLAIHKNIFDITSRKRMEEALSENEKKYRRIVETAHEGIWLIDAEGRTTYVNQRMSEMLGHSIEEMMGTSLLDFMDDSVKAQALQLMERRRQGIQEQHDFRFRRNDGTDLWAIVVTTPIFDDEGIYQGALGMLTDITERKLMEKQLQQSEKKFRTLFEIAPIGISVLDRSQQIMEMNSALETITQMTRPGLEAGAYRNRRYIRPDGTPMRLEEFASTRALRENQPVHGVETGIVVENGEVIWTRINAAPLELSDTGVVVVTQDITDFKRAEEELRKSEARYRGIIEDQTELICRFLPNGTLTFVNEAYCQYFGRSREELIGHSYTPLIPDEDRAHVDESLSKLTPSNPVTTIENRVILEDGSLRWNQWINRAILGDSGQIVEYAAVGRDITDSKILQEREREFAAVQERQHLARDLHDAVSQTLFSARLTSEMLLRQKDNILPDLLWHSIAHIADLIKSALGEMRILLVELRPEGLADASLPNLLSHLVDAAHGRIEAGIHTQIEEQCEPPQDVKIAFYRIAQEALNNIIKHSNCTEIWITLECQPAMIRLEVQDNGQGFDNGSGKNSQLGINIMRERAGEVGARIDISSQAGTGTRVSCIWQPREAVQ